MTDHLGVLLDTVRRLSQARPTGNFPSGRNKPEGCCVQGLGVHGQEGGNGTLLLLLVPILNTDSSHFSSSQLSGAGSCLHPRTLGCHLEGSLQSLQSWLPEGAHRPTVTATFCYIFSPGWHSCDHREGKGSRQGPLGPVWILTSNMPTPSRSAVCGASAHCPAGTAPHFQGGPDAAPHSRLLSAAEVHLLWALAFLLRTER
nr:uncharacterized protein LOC123462708 isoform X2 [Jaculus jaculus]